MNIPKKRVIFGIPKPIPNALNIKHMKKLLLLPFATLVCTSGFALNATDFTATDCSSNSHNLFTELAAGKVVVICWAMPCGACIAPASTASNTVSGMGNPNVVFYLVDDYGNTNCTTLNSWASTNSITYNASFGNSGNVIRMTDYGTTGMPKTVVIGPSGYVTFNVNGTVSQSALQAAINNALTGVNESEKPVFNAAVFPNPAKSAVKFSYSLAVSGDVSIDVLNTLGENVKTITVGNQPAGKHEQPIELSGLAEGTYFIRLNAGKSSETVKFTLQD
jgi:hypothetical protein